MHKSQVHIESENIARILLIARASEYILSVALYAFNYCENLSTVFYLMALSFFLVHFFPLTLYTAISFQLLLFFFCIPLHIHTVDRFLVFPYYPCRITKPDLALSATKYSTSIGSECARRSCVFHSLFIILVYSYEIVSATMFLHAKTKRVILKKPFTYSHYSISLYTVV